MSTSSEYRLVLPGELHEGRLYLDVPYGERDDARRKGACWNAARRLWYVPVGLSYEPFVRWLPKDHSGKRGGLTMIKKIKGEA